MPIVEPTKSEAPELEDGLYEVVCVGVEERTADDDKFGNSEKLEFQLRITDKLDGEGNPITLKPRINRKWTEKANLFVWAVAFGLDPDPNEPIDTDEFKGKHAKALIRTETEGSWPRVKELMPVGKAAKAARPLAERLTGAEPDYDGFWKQIRAAGFDRPDVALHIGDLRKVAEMNQAELDKVVAEMTTGPDDLPFTE